MSRITPYLCWRPPLAEALAAGVGAVGARGWPRGLASQMTASGGCSFVSSKCVDNGAALATPTPTFCTTDGARGCTVDHKAVATCNLSPLSVAVPAPFQYFPSDPTKGGTQITADFCPCAHPQSNRNES
eukprot:7390139-Prymnesium_polylepis.1